jgi:AcrR family transcriptional regulator
MRQTPWGDGDNLRERMLRPGPGIPREDVARSQRERVFAAMVVCVAERGYEATTVADLLELSGTSRSAFYMHFRDKEDCLLATFDALVEKSRELVDRELKKAGSDERRARKAMNALVDSIVRQPAAAKLCFNEVYAVGRRGRSAVERSMADFVAVAGDTIATVRDDGHLPQDMVQGLLGSTQMIIQSRLRRNEEKALPRHAEELWDWAFGYEPPDAPLRLGGRRTRRVDGAQHGVAYDQAEKIIRALATIAGERGYPAVTIAEIAARASVSQATFYSYFEDKDAALVAALDSIGARMLGVVMPAARRAPDWATGVRAGLGALCGFFAAEPDLARLVAVETVGAGPVGLEQRDRTIESMHPLLEPAYEASPDTKPILAEAVLGAIWALLQAKIVATGPENLPQVAPLASYMVLAPFIGAEEAVKIANGDGRRHDR